MKIVWDEATKRKFYGLLPFGDGAFVEWTPDPLLELPEGERPVFHVCPFSKETRKMVAEAVRGGSFSDETMRQALKQAVPAWKNLPTLSDLVDVPYSPEAVDGLPDGLIGLLYAKASELTYGLQKEEKEGLESSPPPA